jgi:hypothetical protein
MVVMTIASERAHSERIHPNLTSPRTCRGTADGAEWGDFTSLTARAVLVVLRLVCAFSPYKAFAY